ncbi:hypothetical protein [Zafaria sp. J156]|nr:hypothetical protein [Zafaria sp. J156]MEE1622781.1 hypothetical protein [Zafaria sp. J156]
MAYGIGNSFRHVLDGIIGDIFDGRPCLAKGIYCVQAGAVSH